MDPIEFDVVDGSVQLQGFPEAEHVGALSGSRAGQIADLALHLQDLSYAREALDELFANRADESVVQDALWRSALVAYFKCFQRSAARGVLLDPAQTLDGEPPEARQAHDHLKALRNKHVVHDENAWSQAIVAAVINRAGSDVKVARVAMVSIRGRSLTQETANGLRLLVNCALAYAERTLDQLCDEETAELERLERAELLALPAPTFTAPAADDVSRRR